MTSANVVNTTTATFEADVIAESLNRPVLVDFWAPWCAPCRTLMPMLERVVEGYNGAVKLVKVNADEEPSLMQAVGVRNLPTVVMFKDGKLIDGFMGALPEGQVRTFLAKHVIEADETVAEELLPEPLSADVEARIASLREKIAADANKEEPRAELADLLAQNGELDEAEKLLHSLAALAEGDAGKRVRARIHFAKVADAAPSAIELQDRIAKDSKDLSARHALAARFIAAAQYPQAMDQWLTILRTDRTFESDLGRRSLLDAFRLCDDAELVADYRRKLSSAVF